MQKGKVYIQLAAAHHLALSGLDFSFFRRYVASKYLYMLVPVNEEDAQVIYEDVYDLNDYDQTPSP